MLKGIIHEFEADGNGEKFCPTFHNCIFKKYNDVFPLLSRASAYAVGLELTNHIMAFLSAGFTGNTDHCTVFFESFSLSEKEMGIVAYLSGYVFSTFSGRLRRSEHWMSEQS